MVMKQKGFIEKIKSKALELQIKYIILPSLTISQATCESGGGKSLLASEYNNLFGFKWTKGCGYDYVELWTSEFVDGRYIRVKARFRRYKNWNESLEDYGRLIGTTKRYAPVRRCKDYICATEQIRRCGYATSPTYTQTLRRIIEQYKLYEFDNVKEEEQMRLEKVYKRGSKGLPVKFIQKAINNYIGVAHAVVLSGAPEWYPLDIDGLFGPLTEKAVKWYQEKELLDIGGKVEKKTFESLVSLSASAWNWFCVEWAYGER